MARFLYALIIFFLTNAVASASEIECKYKKEFIDADLRCKGDGDCMFPRFQGITSYEGDFNDYMDCIDWKLRKVSESNQNNKDENLSSKEGDFYVNRGVERLDSGDVKGAISDFSEAINLKFNLPVNYRNRAVAKYQLKEYKGAILDISKSIDIKPTGQSYLIRGEIKKQTGDIYGSCFDWENAKKLYIGGLPPTEINKHDYFCQNFYSGGDISRWNKFNKFNNKGVRKLKAADYEGALKQFLQAKELYPNDPRLNRNLGKLYFLLNNYEKSIIKYTRAIKSFPTYSNFWFERSTVKQAMGDIKGSCKDYNNAISLSDKELRDIFLGSEREQYCSLQPDGN